MPSYYTLHRPYTVEVAGAQVPFVVESGPFPSEAAAIFALAGYFGHDQASIERSVETEGLHIVERN